MVYNKYNTLNNMISLCTNKNTLIVILKFITTIYNHSIKQLSITNAVHNKTTISFNSSMLKKLKSPESSFIHKSLTKIASFAEYTCLST